MATFKQPESSLYANPFAFITGASSGIGYELAKQCASHGHDVLLVAEDAAIHDVAEEIGSVYGVWARGLQCDLSTYSGIDALCSDLELNDRPIDVAVLNAGIGVGGKFIENSLQAEMELIQLNVVSTVCLSKYVAQDMAARGKAGRILITSSVAATMPGPYMAVYNASKAFVQSFAEALHYELEEKGIHVTALMPGATDTNFFHRAGLDDTKLGTMEKDDPAEVAEQGYDAMLDGKSHVIAGSLKTRVMNTANDLIPEQTKAKMHAKQAKPGSAAGTK